MALQVVGPVLQKAVLITAFVAAMMVLVDWLNVLTSGGWRRAFCGTRWLQYLAAIALGATPGCLGAFVVVALYVHRTVSLGALVGCMIATSGDEAFVMFALFPRTALLLTLGMMGVGLVAAVLTDAVVGEPAERAGGCHALPLHEGEGSCRCLDRESLLPQLSHPTGVRIVLVAGTAAFLGAILAGLVGPPAWSWVRWTLALVSALVLFIVSTAPDHFLKEHLWGHVVVRHVPRLFAWTLGALTAIALLNAHATAQEIIRSSPRAMVLLAALVGIVPESGPHLLFVTLYDNGTVPLAVLAASSIVQDGHGMLPLLAESWRDFVKVKGINLAAGLIIGLLMLTLARIFHAGS